MHSDTLNTAKCCILLRSLCHKLWWKYILFEFHPYFRYIVITKILLLFLCYVHYAVVKTKKTLFFVNNNHNFTTMFTTPKSWKIPYFYSTTTFTKAWLWQKNIVFISQLRGLHCDNWEKGFRSYCYYLHYVVMKRNFFFHFVATFTPQLYREKSFFFHVVATFTTPWSRYNTFFSTSALYWLLHSHIIKKFDSYCTTTLTTLCSWKK